MKQQEVPVSYISITENYQKESLISDGHQFHQYQQNEQSPLSLAHWTQKRPWHMTLEIQILAWDRHKNVIV